MCGFFSPSFPQNVVSQITECGAFSPVYASLHEIEKEGVRSYFSMLCLCCCIKCVHTRLLIVCTCAYECVSFDYTSRPWEYLPV